MKKRLKKDIVIPAGTIFNDHNNVKTIYVMENFIHTIGLTKDSCGSLIYCVDSDDQELTEWFEDVK